MNQSRTISDMAPASVWQINLAALRATCVGAAAVDEPWDDGFDDDDGNQPGDHRRPFITGLPQWAVPRGGDDVVAWCLIKT